jgi:small subunit ribosomal protein S17|tara:strand:- start:1604 stop:1978 length:375 start_codon:yes stop_codon:yes gene_type:complete
MEEKKITPKGMTLKSLKKKAVISCADKFCPIHGEKKLKVRGRVFEGEVIKKLHGRVTIQFERMIKVRKYERYEKRRTKIHARLPECMENDVNVGDLIQIGETRPISKMIHCVVIKVIRKMEEKE